MKTPHLKTVLLGAALVAGAIALTPAAMAANHDRLYRVTIQNATLGQPLSPPVIATHTKAFQLFELGPVPTMGDDGYAQYLGLAAVAETGYPFHLFDAVSVADGVSDAVVLPPVLHEGDSNSTTISASGNAKYLSVASMLGRTNDGFWALRGVALPRGIGDTAHYFANGYDAGSEENLETTGEGGTVGGADGDNGETLVGINDGSGEGYIFVHAGIQGVGGLDPTIYDWRNPVVEVTIERVQ
jgi:hypothetical protein